MEFFDVGQRAHGVIAIGQEATGVIAIGQDAMGIIAIGQVARGVFTLGQLSVGLFNIGMLAVGVIYSLGMIGIGARGMGLVLRFVPPLRPKTPSGERIPQSFAAWLGKLTPFAIVLFVLLAFLWFHLVFEPLLGSLALEIPADPELSVDYRVGPSFGDAFLYPVFALVALLVVTGVAALRKRGREKRERQAALARRGVTVEAAVVGVQETNLRINKRPVVKIQLEATLNDGREVSLHIRKTIGITSQSWIEVGAIHHLTYDPEELDNRYLTFAGSDRIDTVELEILRVPSDYGAQGAVSAGPLDFLPQAELKPRLTLEARDDASGARFPVKLTREALVMEPPGSAPISIRMDAPFNVALGHSRRGRDTLLHVDLQQRRYGMSVRLGLSSTTASFSAPVTALPGMSPQYPALSEEDMLALLAGLGGCMQAQGGENWGVGPR